MENKEIVNKIAIKDSSVVVDLKVKFLDTIKGK